jgi:hypothetical protein
MKIRFKEADGAISFHDCPTTDVLLRKLEKVLDAGHEGEVIIPASDEQAKERILAVLRSKGIDVQAKTPPGARTMGAVAGFRGASDVAVIAGVADLTFGMIELGADALSDYLADLGAQATSEIAAHGLAFAADVTGQTAAGGGFLAHSLIPVVGPTLAVARGAWLAYRVYKKVQAVQSRQQKYLIIFFGRPAAVLAGSPMPAPAY